MASQKTPYQQFLGYLKKWRAELGVNDVVVNASPDTIDDHNAMYEYDPQARVATIYFDEESNEDATPDQLDYLAFHEISHIRYGDLEYLATRRDFDRAALEVEIHRLIIGDWDRMKK